MRRSYISPEFGKKNVFGTLNMLEEGNFFGAKMLEIEDKLSVTNENFVWHEMSSGEQIDSQTESILDPIVLSSAISKLNNHTITIDPTQTQYTKDNATRWILDINIVGILTDQLYAKMKNARTFEGVRSRTTIYNDIRIAVAKYIEMNVVNRYRMSKFELYLKYIDLRSQNVLRFNNTWNENVMTSEYEQRKFQTVSDYNDKRLRVIFSQEKPSTQYKLDYFFNVYFEKI
jgi:hypothetical protein